MTVFWQSVSLGWLLCSFSSSSLCCCCCSCGTKNFYPKLCLICLWFIASKKLAACTQSQRYILCLPLASRVMAVVIGDFDHLSRIIIKSIFFHCLQSNDVRFTNWPHFKFFLSGFTYLLKTRIWPFLLLWSAYFLHLNSVRQLHILREWLKSSNSYFERIKTISTSGLSHPLYNTYLLPIHFSSILYQLW